MLELIVWTQLVDMFTDVTYSSSETLVLWYSSSETLSDSGRST